MCINKHPKTTSPFPFDTNPLIHTHSPPLFSINRLQLFLLIWWHMKRPLSNLFFFRSTCNQFSIQPSMAADSGLWPVSHRRLISRLCACETQYLLARLCTKPVVGTSSFSIFFFLSFIIFIHSWKLLIKHTYIYPLHSYPLFCCCCSLDATLSVFVLC